MDRATPGVIVQDEAGGAARRSDAGDVGPQPRRPRRIALLTSARSWRGSGVSFLNLARGLPRYGYEPHLLVGDPEVGNAFAAHGLSTHQVPLRRTGLAEAAALARALRRVRADVVIADRPRDLRLAGLASMVHRVALVSKYNLSHPTPPSDLLTRFAYRRVRLIVFVSHALATRVLGAAPYLRRPRHRVIPEAVDMEVFRPDPAASHRFRAERALGPAAFVLAVGSLTPDKRYDFLVDLWAHGREWLPPLLICGEGPHGARLRSRAQELGVRVRFLGRLSPDDLRGAYNAASCLIHVGAVETFGLSVLEAMACGRPVLGAAGGALPEVIGPAGVLARPEEPAEFLAALRMLLSDRAHGERLGEAAHRRAVERFSLEAMWREYDVSLQGVIGPGRSAD